MKVSVGTRLQNGRVINLEVDDNEAEEVFGTKWLDWKTSKRFKMLSTYADSLIIYYLKDAGAITPEQAKSRIAALQEILQNA